MDRVRAAIFSSLGERVPGARVLDLFAGSGGMGIEALSRGAESAVFVDESEHCVRCIRENLGMARVEAVVQTMDAYRYLDLYAEEASFDLIFADPPYSKKQGDTDHSALLATSLEIATALKPDGIFVLEKQSGGPAVAESVFEILRCKRYGGSEVLYLAKK
jgi:16S rRNA (guanine966-N2)-methyltransferase